MGVITYIVDEDDIKAITSTIFNDRDLIMELADDVNKHVKKIAERLEEEREIIRTLIRALNITADVFAWSESSPKIVAPLISIDITDDITIQVLLEAFFYDRESEIVLVEAVFVREEYDYTGGNKAETRYTVPVMIINDN